MAVIKIVPMPGAVGDKGDPGETGPQGPQGQTGQTGQNGQDALWNYNGAYNPGAGYAVGDVVTYEGQTWYRKHANGGNVGDTPSQGIFWDLVAAKGADAKASSGEITSTSGTWNPRFAELSNITYSDETSLHELGEYYCVGDLVFFDVLVKLNNVSDWGTSILWSFELPFIERHHAMAGWQSGMPNPTFVGNIVDSTIAEDINQRTARDQGSYAVYGELEQTNPNRVSLFVTAYDNSTGYAVGELKGLNKSYPSDLTQPEIQQSGFRMSGVYRKA